MHVFIVGAGKMGSYLAADLKTRGHTVSLMERDPQVAAKASKELGVHIIIGDGTELAALRSTNMRKADAMVAATGDDEDNLVACLLAKTEFEIKRVVARVNHPKNEWLFTKAMGVDSYISQSHLMAKLVEEELTIGDLVTLLKLRRGDLSLVEVTVAPGSAAAGKEFREIPLPPGAVVVGIARGSDLILPAPEVTIQAGDQVLVVTKVEGEPDLAALFRSG